MTDRIVRLLLGPNGCGKGTIAKYLSAMDAHVETVSDVLAEEKKSNPDVAEIIRLHKDELKVNVPCDVVIAAMFRRLETVFEQKPSGLFALDGFGRTPRQIQESARIIRVQWPTTDIGFVFLTLSYEEAMQRIAKRVKEFEKAGRPVRAEDLGDEPRKRFEVYAAAQESLITQARDICGNVTILDLDKYTTLEVAAQILCMVSGKPAFDIARDIRRKLEAA